MNKVKKFVYDYRYILLFLLGMTIMILRSSFGLKYPSLYAEDGIWTSYLLKNGYSWTVLNARADYFPIVIVTMLQLAKTLSDIFTNGDISYIPIFSFYISCIYFTFVAMLPAMTLGKRINWIAKLFLFLGLLCIPLGNSYTEILGRTLQCHFYIWIIVFCLLVYRYDNKNNKKFLITLIDIALIPLIMTFPSVLLEYGIYGLIEIYDIIKKYFLKNRQSFKDKFKLMFKSEIKKYHIKSLIISFIVIFLLSIYILMRMKNANMDFDTGFNYKNMIEIIIRVFIFNFVFGFYNKLNNPISVIIIILYASLIIYSFFKMENKSRSFYIISLLSFISIGIITLASRGSITFFQNGYSDTYPDRYYMCTNAMALFPISVIVSEGFKNKRNVLKYIAIFMIVIMLINILLSFNNIFALSSNKTSWIKNKSLKDRIQESFNLDKRTEDGKNYIVDIDPEWTFEIPLELIDNSVKK